MSMKARFCVRSLIAVLVGVLVATAGAATRKAQATTTITLSALNTQQPGFDVLIANFERVYPNITVKPSYLPITTYVSLVPTQLQAGNGSDVLYTSAGSGLSYGTEVLAQAGYLADLTSQPYIKRIPPTALPGISLGVGKARKIYAFNDSINPVVTYYNKAVFKAGGWKVPTTWQGLLNMCAAANAKGIAAIGLAGAQSVDFAALLQLFAGNEVQSKDPNWILRRRNGQVTFAGSQLWQNALQRVVDLKNAKCFSPNILGETRNSSIAELHSGRILMYVQGGSVYSQFAAGFGNDVGDLAAFALPAPNPKTQRWAFNATAFSVNAHSSQIAAAKTFLTFMARPKQSELYNKLVGTVASYDWLKGTVPAWMAPLKSYLPHKIKGKRTVDKTVFSVLQNFPPGPTFSDMYTLTGGLFSGQQTIDSILAKADADFNASRH